MTADLGRFKNLVEKGYATGSWRRSINEGAGLGTPGAGMAAASEGDSGKAAVSGKAGVAGRCRRRCGQVLGGGAGGARRAPGERRRERPPVETIPPVQRAPAVPETAPPLIAPMDITGGAERIPPPHRTSTPPDEPVETAGLTSDGSVLTETPDTTTGKEQLVQNDEGRPGV